MWTLQLEKVKSCIDCACKYNVLLYLCEFEWMLMWRHVDMGGMVFLRWKCVLSERNTANSLQTLSNIIPYLQRNKGEAWYIAGWIVSPLGKTENGDDFTQQKTTTTISLQFKKTDEVWVKLQNFHITCKVRTLCNQIHADSIGFWVGFMQIQTGIHENHWIVLRHENISN